MVIALAQTLLSYAKFRPLRVIKKDIILLTLDWLWGCPRAFAPTKECFKHSLWFVKNDTKRTPSQNWGDILSELHVLHRQCLAGISDAFSASFTSIWPSFPRFYCTPNKACLLCATPARTYRVQSPWISEDHLLMTCEHDCTYVLLTQVSLWKQHERHTITIHVNIITNCVKIIANYVKAIDCESRDKIIMCR